MDYSDNSILERSHELIHLVPSCCNCFMMESKCSILEAKNQILLEKLETLQSLVDTTLEISVMQTEFGTPTNKRTVSPNISTEVPGRR